MYAAFHTSRNPRSRRRPEVPCTLFADKYDTPLRVGRRYTNRHGSFEACHTPLQCFVGGYGYDMREDVLAVVKVEDITHTTAHDVCAQTMTIERVVPMEEMKTLLKNPVRIGHALNYKDYSEGLLHSSGDLPACHVVYTKSVLDPGHFRELVKRSIQHEDGDEDEDVPSSVPSSVIPADFLAEAERFWDIALCQCETVCIDEWYWYGVLNMNKDMPARVLIGRDVHGREIVSQREWFFSGVRHRETYPAFIIAYTEQLTPTSAFDSRFVFTKYPNGFSLYWHNGVCHRQEQRLQLSDSEVVDDEMEMELDMGIHTPLAQDLVTEADPVRATHATHTAHTAHADPAAFPMGAGDLSKITKARSRQISFYWTWAVVCVVMCVAFKFMGLALYVDVFLDVLGALVVLFCLMCILILCSFC